MDQPLTPADVRRIAATSGYTYAVVCVEQEASWVGREAAAPLFDELDRLEAEAP